MMSKFTWRIENFSKLVAEKLDSLTFVVNENRWYAPQPREESDINSLAIRLAYLQNGGYQQSSVYLLLTRLTPTKPSRKVRSSLYCWQLLINLMGELCSTFAYCAECEQTFYGLAPSSGWSNFIERSKFHDEVEGYLVEDTCLIEAVVDDSPASSYKDSDSPVAIDPVYIEAQSFLQSLPKAPSTCGSPLFERYAKEIFDKLISYRLDDLADPMNETTMMEFISVLANNISVFSDVQAREIVNLKATFPQTMQEWRDSMSQAKGTGQPSRSLFEETKSVLQDLVKTEEGIKTKLEELHKKETELEAELEAIEGKSQMLKEERGRVPKQMKILCGLVEEMASSIGALDYEVDCAKYLQFEQRLRSNWAAMRHLFA
ncbi:hypothetical protein DM860_000281 [Cuscuta australis]|uniref:MATH domain-containing protein n=1 Tax=Cuscuta australis TaxID=267555 RepID=A0A328CW08_9ASTE|nr:hypothetical protein DM860_000281 [Cuscuta australis]